MWQALMAGSSFCAFMDGLRAAAPALPPSDVPHLYNFSQLARCFPVQPQARALSDQPQPQAQDRAVSEQAQAKADAEQPQAEDDSAAQPSVNGHEADEEERSESKADSEVMSVDGKAESVKSDSKPESKAEISAASRADAKAAPKGSRASSRGPSSDGGVDPKAGKAVPKVASRVRADSNTGIVITSIDACTPCLAECMMLYLFQNSQNSVILRVKKISSVPANISVQGEWAMQTLETQTLVGSPAICHSNQYTIANSANPKITNPEPCSSRQCKPTAANALLSWHEK